jgi:hypothetical protein
LSWQLLKAGTSIGANMEEADAGQTKRDFIAKTAIARKESHHSSLQSLCGTGTASPMNGHGGATAAGATWT